MELENIKQNTVWNDAAESINSNFAKIRQKMALIESGAGGSANIDVDTAMSDTSENAVANRVIKKYVDERAEQAYEQANEYTNEKIASLREEIANSDGAKAIELQQEWVDGQEHSIGMTWEEYIATPYVVFTFPSQDGANLRFERVALCDRTANFTDIYVETQIGSSETAIVAEVFKSGTDAVIKFIDDIKALPRFLPTTNNADSKFLNAEGKWVEVQTDVDHPVFEFTYDTTTNKATAEMVAALAEAIAADKLILCNGRTYKFILEQDEMYGLVSDAYMDIMDGKLKTSILAVTASSYDVQLMEEEVPVGTEITEATIRNWGFTKNAGTITGIMMNGVSKGTSGVVDLGTVITAHQQLKTINGQSIVGSGNIEIQGGSATPRVEMTAASAAIEPNKFYVWPMMDSLDLTFGTEQSGVMNRYLFQFRNPKAGLTMLTLPADITWSEDTELDENGLPVMEAAAFYRIEIIEGLASLKKWKLVYIQFADAEVERVLMANGVGDGIGITKKDAKEVDTIGSFKGNTIVESFDEFELFENVTFLQGNDNLTNALNSAAFYGCTNLKKIKFPPNFQEIRGGSFAGTTALAIDVDIPTLTDIGNNAFRKSGVRRLLNLGAIPDFGTYGTLSYGGEGVCYQCTNLEVVILPESCILIPGCSFFGCSALQVVVIKGVIPPSLSGAYAFSGSTCPIYVPDDSVEAYKAAQNWNSYASRIKGISELSTDNPTLYAEVQEYL